MPSLPEADRTYAVHCPHCRKRFESSPMPGRAARYAGFKCPHCKLFVPFERVADQDGASDGAA
jgi:tRNA(Ile2) C34 agmatinyltransferase TiaS